MAIPASIRLRAAIADLRQEELTDTLGQVGCRGPHGRGWDGPCGFCGAVV